MAKTEFLHVGDEAIALNEGQGLFRILEYKNSAVYRVKALDLVHPRLRPQLEKQLIESAAEGFVRPLDDDFRLDVATHLREGILYVVIANGEACGFGVFKDFQHLDATYISGIVKSPRAPSGVVEVITAQHVHNKGVVVVRTQNDRVVEIIQDVCELVVPVHREPSNMEFDVLEAMGLLDKGNVGKNMVAVEHYGGAPMIQGVPRRRSNVEVVSRTTDRLKYYQGDALLLVGYRQKGKI